jgi:hypothetical protein
MFWRNGNLLTLSLFGDGTKRNAIPEDRHRRAPANHSPTNPTNPSFKLDVQGRRRRIWPFSEGRETVQNECFGSDLFLLYILLPLSYKEEKSRRRYIREGNISKLNWPAKYPLLLTTLRSQPPPGPSQRFKQVSFLKFTFLTIGPSGHSSGPF